MYVELGERVGFVPGGTNIGILRNDDRHVTLIDSGLNDTTARKVLRVVRDELGCEVVAIINTHAHADHFGANAFVHKRTGCEVWAPEVEATILQHPILNPALLFGGSDPVDALRGRFLLAEPSPVTGCLGPGKQELHGLELELVPLPGHSPNHMGIVCDGVYFCADVVFPDAAIEKYRIPYLYGLTDHLESLARSLDVPCAVVVPGHGSHHPSIDDSVARNRAAIDMALAAVIDAVGEPRSSDDVCVRVFAALDVPVSDAQGYYLLRPTISACLAHLERTGEVVLDVRDRRALWRRR